jgi:uncharacterized membrane protein
MMGKHDEFTFFHAKQGIVLFGIEVAVFVVATMLHMFPLIGLLNLATLVLTIIGIVNVVQDKKAELPVIGSLAQHVNF